MNLNCQTVTEKASGEILVVPGRTDQQNLAALRGFTLADDEIGAIGVSDFVKGCFIILNVDEVAVVTEKNKANWNISTKINR
jgi:hypothetical protein